MRGLLVLLVGVLACDQAKPEPTKGTDRISAAASRMVLPEVTKDFPPPQPTSVDLVVIKRGEPVFVGMRGDAAEPPRIYIAVDPTMRCEELFAKLDQVRQTGSDISLVVRTPKGIGALPLHLPRAMTGDEPLLVLTIARTANGQPRLILGSRTLALGELEAALRETPRKHLALDVDHSTTVGTFAQVLALASSVVPDVSLIAKPAAPQVIEHP